MFSDLPKLFDRDFITGYFLPATVYVLATLTLIVEFGLLPMLVVLLPPGVQWETLLGITAIGLVSWLLAISLLALNRWLLRLLEGYVLGDWGIFRIATFLRDRQIKRYVRLQKKKAGSHHASTRLSKS